MDSKGAASRARFQDAVWKVMWQLRVIQAMRPEARWKKYARLLVRLATEDCCNWPFPVFTPKKDCRRTPRPPYTLHGQGLHDILLLSSTGSLGFFRGFNLYLWTLVLNGQVWRKHQQIQMSPTWKDSHWEGRHKQGWVAQVLTTLGYSLLSYPWSRLYLTWVLKPQDSLWGVVRQLGDTYGIGQSWNAFSQLPSWGNLGRLTHRLVACMYQGYPRQLFILGYHWWSKHQKISRFASFWLDIGIYLPLNHWTTQAIVGNSEAVPPLWAMYQKVPLSLLYTYVIFTPKSPIKAMVPLFVSVFLFQAKKAWRFSVVLTYYRMFLRQTLGYFVGDPPIASQRMEFPVVLEALHLQSLTEDAMGDLMMSSLRSPNRGNWSPDLVADFRKSLEFPVDLGKPSQEAPLSASAPLSTTDFSGIPARSWAAPAVEVYLAPSVVSHPSMTPDPSLVCGEYYALPGQLLNDRTVYKKTSANVFIHYRISVADHFSGWCLSVDHLFSDPLGTHVLCALTSAQTPYDPSLAWGSYSEWGFSIDVRFRIRAVACMSLLAKRRVVLDCWFQSLQSLSLEDPQTLDEFYEFSHPWEHYVLYVDRNSLVVSTFQELMHAWPNQLLAYQFEVVFLGEIGEDGGGLQKELFAQVAAALCPGAPESVMSGWPKKLISPDNRRRRQWCQDLFVYGHDQTLWPRGADPLEEFNLERLAYFACVGRLLAMAMVREIPFPLPLNPLILKLLLGKLLGAKDLAQADAHFYEHRVKDLLRQGGLERAQEYLGDPLTFMSAPSPGNPRVEPLRTENPGELVTPENLDEYLSLLCQHYLVGSIQTEVTALCRGFWELIPKHMLAAADLSPLDLQALTCGNSLIDIQEWKACARWQIVGLAGSSGDSSQAPPIFDWFFEILQSWSDLQRELLLRFSTGSSRLPVEGFSSLKPPFLLVFHQGQLPEDKLPTAHTCGNQLCLPLYPTKQILTNKLLFILNYASVGFHFV